MSKSSSVREMRDVVEEVTVRPKAQERPKITGLTKRELFTMFAMQGLIAKDGHYMNATVNEKAPQFADAALNMLGSNGDDRVI